LKHIYIFDLDGTLANCQHRVGILEDKDNKNRWRDFYAACDKDEPNEPIIKIFNMIIEHGHDVIIFSGRSTEVRKKTEAWLCKHTCLMSWDAQTMLRMRDIGDHRPDDIVKKDWLDSMLIDDREKIACVFDDRDRVVKMWRDAGITCLQVNYGDF
jgi:acid phosphatase class B